LLIHLRIVVAEGVFILKLILFKLELLELWLIKFLLVLWEELVLLHVRLLVSLMQLLFGSWRAVSYSGLAVGAL
jgi:hypothetical protein